MRRRRSGGPDLRRRACAPDPRRKGRRGGIYAEELVLRILAEKDVGVIPGKNFFAGGAEPFAQGGIAQKTVESHVRPQSIAILTHFTVSLYPVFPAFASGKRTAEEIRPIFTKHPPGFFQHGFSFAEYDGWERTIFPERIRTFLMTNRKSGAILLIDIIAPLSA